MASARTPRRAWIEEALRALSEGGPDAVRVEALARRLGVSKGGFYWHFDDRGALLEEMLDSWERQVVDQVIEVVDAGGGDARARLAGLFSMVTAEVRTSDLAIRDWARRDRGVARRLRRVDNRRIDYMRGLFSEFCSDDGEVEARCVWTRRSGPAAVRPGHREVGTLTPPACWTPLLCLIHTRAYGWAL